MRPTGPVVQAVVPCALCNCPCVFAAVDGGSPSAEERGKSVARSVMRLALGFTPERRIDVVLLQLAKKMEQSRIKQGLCFGT